MPHVEIPVVLTSTRAESGLRCHRRHVLSDVLEFGKCKSPSGAFGNVMHGAVATYWTELLGERSYPVVLEMTRDSMESGYAKHMAGACSIGDHTLERAAAMLDVYVNNAELAGPFTSVGSWRDMLIEQRLVIDVGEHKLSFQQDRSAYNKAVDWLVIVDLKTAAQFSPRWRKGWDRSLQMKLYKWAALEFYAAARTDVVIEGLLKAAKPKMQYIPLPEWSPAILREAVEAFKYVADLDRELLEASMLTDGTIDMDTLEQNALNNTTPNYHDCDAYGYDCPFLPLCTTDPQYRQGLLHEGYITVEQDY